MNYIIKFFIALSFTTIASIVNAKEGKLDCAWLDKIVTDEKNDKGEITREEYITQSDKAYSKGLEEFKLFEKITLKPIRRKGDRISFSI
ncbi:MAG: hypothetical protein ABL927_13060, partial [Bdellovibrionales bacterium]